MSDYPRIADADAPAQPFRIDPMVPTRGVDEVDEPTPTSTPHVDQPPASTVDQPRGKRQKRPSTGNRSKPTNAPRFNGNAGVNVFRDLMQASDAEGIPSPAVCVWFALWTYAHDDGTATVSNTTLANVTHMSRRHVVNMVKVLAERGLLTVLKRGSSQSHTPNMYRLNATPTPPETAVAGERGSLG